MAIEVLMWWLLSCALAWAQGPIPVYTEGATRAVKVDIYSFGQALDPFGTDWDTTDLQLWSAVLDCTMGGGRRETCTFRSEEAWWGYVRTGTTDLKVHHIPMKGTFELVWSPVGRLASWDIRGDRASFYETASNARLDLYHRQDVVWKPAAAREIGEHMEEDLLKGFAAALEVELPPKGKMKENAWVSSKAPIVARRYEQGTATGRLEYSLGGTPEAPQVSLVGRVSESEAQNRWQVEAQVIGEYVLDPGTWRPVATRVESAHFTTTTNLTGHTRFLGTSRPYAEGESTQPTPFPGALIQ